VRFRAVFQLIVPLSVLAGGICSSLASALGFSAGLANCCGEIVDFCSLADGETGEIREKRRVCPLAARVGCDASELQYCRRQGLVDREVVRSEARVSSKRITG
jgi:hypothetical protein